MARIFRSGEVNIVLYVLVIIFGSGSWIAINGLWVELPLLVHQLPEGWSLPSYLVIIVQLANIAPIGYTIARKFCHRDPQNIYTYILVIIGSVSCFLLCFFWSKTAEIAGNEYSIALFILAFCISIVDCSSSVVFLPYMAKLRSSYITAFFIGEGLSGLLPSLVALAQGAKDTECVNRTVNGTSTIVPVPVTPNFEVSVFCGFLCGMMILCGLAYFLMNNLTSCRREHIGNINSVTTEEELREETETETESRPMIRSDSKLCMAYFLVVTAWLNAMGNGLLPSLQSYATLPYGDLAYHLAVTLRSVMTPAVCFLMFLRPVRSRAVASAFIAAVTLWQVVVFYLAAKSPEPPLADTALGGVLVVIFTIVSAALLSSTKVILATIMRDMGADQLFWYGALKQVGSAGGATVGFLLVTTFHLFKSKPPCS